MKDRTYYTDAMIAIESNYVDIFGEILDEDRLNELEAHLYDCASLDDLDELADRNEEISFGERDAMEPVAKAIFGLEYAS